LKGDPNLLQHPTFDKLHELHELGLNGMRQSLN
jgi:hypothetical protein